MTTYYTMRARIDAYLDRRRRAGFLLRSEGAHLMLFARFADRSAHQGPLTSQLALQWATALRKPNARTTSDRIAMLRRFARHWQLVEPGTEMPRKPGGRAAWRLTPHIYTDRELRQLLTAAAQISPSGCLRAHTCATIFGLIAATGLRISEAIGLQRPDVNLDEGLLKIRHAKFGKARWVPIHRTTVQALKRYVQRRDRDTISSGTAAFFMFDRGRSVNYRKIAYVFRELRGRLKWRARGGHPVPRIHDIRHTFVCRRLERWSREGEDVDCNILALSTYIGHVKVSKTYWYVTATPALMSIAAERFERNMEGFR